MFQGLIANENPQISRSILILTHLNAILVQQAPGIELRPIKNIISAVIITRVQSILCIPTLVSCCNPILATRMERQETWIYWWEETEDFEGNGDHLPPT